MYKKLLLLLTFCTNIVFAQTKPNPEWVAQKFSMFIHFGLYSELGGVWNGKKVESGYSEQIQSHGGIFSDWYAAVANRFDPEKWNADEIVSLAKAAGMKSIVFTSKHHDGFCMYHSRYTDFNIADATPFKRDIMKELSEACATQGIKFAVYYSLIDWHFPEAYPISSHNADPLTSAHYQYNLKQVEEIMTNYGPISEIWFDMGSLTPEQSKGLYDLVNRLQPECMISGRLGNDCSDFSVMADNEYPDYKIGVPWQTAASFFDETWGYRSWQERGNLQDKVNEKILSLLKVVSRGGNYLLNIGPKGDGSVVDFERDALLKIGAWMQKYGEGIYGAEANPFPHPFDWGEVTIKGNDLYLFIDKKSRKTDILLPLQGTITGNSLLGGNGSPITRQEKEGLRVILESGESADSPVNVIRLSLADGFAVQQPVITDWKELSPQNSIPLYAYSSIDYYTGFQSTIAYTWAFNTARKSVVPTIRYTENEKGKTVLLTIDGQAEKIVLDNPQKTTSLNPENIVWGNVYTKPARGVFGAIPAESRGTNPETADSKWEKIENFTYGQIQEIPVQERQGILLLQEIESGKAQEILIEAGSGNGIMIFLNGEKLNAHISQKGNDYYREIVLLPLKAGKNQLLIKLYNRFEKKLRYSLNPEIPQTVYEQNIPAFSLQKGQTHHISLQLAEPAFKNSAMRLNNIEIKLK